MYPLLNQALHPEEYTKGTARFKGFVKVVSSIHMWPAQESN